MARIKNIEEKSIEEKIVWVLTTRNKKTKVVVNRVCKDNNAIQTALAAAKEQGETFITLTTESRIRSFLSGNPVKAWAANYAALTRRGVELDGLYTAVLNWLDCTTEEERWAHDLDGSEVVFREIVDADRIDNVVIGDSDYTG